MTLLVSLMHLRSRSSLKKKNIWANQTSFMTKELQEIMNRSRLRNKSLCFRSDEFFNNVVKELNITIKEDWLCDVSNSNDPVKRDIQK